MVKFFKPILLIVIFIIYFCAITKAELKLISVVFRYGDRAPIKGLENYAKDPHANHEYFPMGSGGLTNNGKIREYKLGKLLRKLYNDFLGDTYYPELVSARSTECAKSKMSLQLVLAGLFKPNFFQKWNKNLDWQPIPTNYVRSLDDTLMLPTDCPKYLLVRERVETSPEFQAKLDTFRDFMQFLSEKTGQNITCSSDMYFLYHGLMAQRSLKLQLPEWTENIFPHGKLLDGANLEYELLSYNKELKRLNGGMLVRKFIDDMEAHKNGNLDPNRKIFLYSGHENVIAVLQTLGIYKPNIPKYTSGIFVELHEVKNEYYVKIKHYKGIPDIYGLYDEVEIPGCDKDNCTLDAFKTILSDVIPSDEDIKCDKRSLRKPIENNKIKVPRKLLEQVLNDIYKEDKARNTLQ